MSDLSRESRDVIEAGARALAPSEAARAKIRAAVAARVSGTPGAGGGEGAAAEASVGVAARGGSAAKVWLATLVLGGIAAGVLGLRGYLNESSGDRPTAALAPDRAAVAPAPAPTVEPPTTIERPAIPPAKAPPPGRARPTRPRAASPDVVASRPERAASTLEREVALLSEARRAMGDGDPDRALAALARHGREVRAPQMAKEAGLLRAEALCADDRAGEGRAVLAEVDARWPGAAGAAAVRARCGSD
jgi:hypothetical protein